ncbi:MAG: amidohydrolase family protein, partial [Candidatus Hodarchaeota archaeon]
MKYDFDIIIKNGKVVDGTGNPAFEADVGIKSGEILSVAPNIEGDAIRIIDAAEHIICPGFIDTHSHTDEILPISGRADSFVRQGITTTTVGMCGASLAPLHPEKIEHFREEMTRHIPLYADVEIPWTSFEEYLNEMEKVESSINLAFFVGFSAVRIAGGPGDDNRPPTPEELDNMRELVDEAMHAGAFGMSTGLIYAPQVYAGTNEILELAKVAGEHKGLYFSHIRGEAETVKDAISEFIQIVEESGVVGGQIAHHKIADKKIWGLSRETLKLIEEANNRGLSVTCDSYPYDRGLSSLATALPPWVLEGGTEDAIERLRDHNKRNRIKTEVLENINLDPTAIWENWILVDGFENIFIAGVTAETWQGYLGKSIPEVTRIRKMKDNWETFFELLVDDEMGTQVTMKSMGDEDIRRIMTSSYQMFGTDGEAVPEDFEFG